ncbi:MAG TPA: hypothetical protein VMR92_14670 [Gemmatimonadales bacterium]|nr:hypothetical protein [Gemmatimonadales bacterium]
MKQLGMVLLAVALGVSAVRPAMAQGSWRYGLSAGALMPIGDYGKQDKMGWVAGAGATYWLPGTGNMGIRADVSYSSTSHEVGTGNNNILGGLASFVYALNPASAPARILLTGGVGYFNLKDTEVSASASKFGFAGGAAVAFKMGKGSTRLVVGSRYTSVSTDAGTVSFVPLTVGLSFGK